MSDNNGENTVLENVANDLNTGIAAICRRMLNMDASIIQGSEAIILEDNIILLIKDGYGIVLKWGYLEKPFFGWSAHCSCCCCSDIKEELKSIARRRKIEILFSDNSCSRGPFAKQLGFSLGQIASLFPGHTPITFLQMIGFDSASAEEGASNYAEYLRDFILKSLSAS